MKKKSNKGITLVALVVTIIVLIILATISIGTIAGKKGIINQAKESKKQHDDAMKKEDESLEELLAEYNNSMKQSSFSNSIDQNKTEEDTIKIILLNGPFWKVNNTSNDDWYNIYTLSKEGLEGKKYQWEYRIQSPGDMKNAYRMYMRPLTEDFTLRREDDILVFKEGTQYLWKIYDEDNKYSKFREPIDQVLLGTMAPGDELTVKIEHTFTKEELKKGYIIGGMEIIPDETIGIEPGPGPGPGTDPIPPILEPDMPQ